MCILSSFVEIRPDLNIYVRLRVSLLFSSRKLLAVYIYVVTNCFLKCSLCFFLQIVLSNNLDNAYIFSLILLFNTFLNSVHVFYTNGE